MLFQKKYVQQLDETDCGAAVLCMILKHYRSNVSLTMIREYAQTDQEGTSALGLIKAAEHFGLESRALQTDTTCFPKQYRSFQYPFIAHVNKQGLLHYIVVLSADSRYVKIADPDPSVRIKKISYAKFNSIWTGIFIYMKPSHDYKKINVGNNSLWEASKILSDQKRIMIGIVLFMILSTLITISGAFFLQQIIDRFVPQHAITPLMLMTMGLATAYAAHGFLNLIEGLWSAILGQRLTGKVLMDFMRHLLRLHISFFESRNLGEISSRFSDANNIISILASTAITTVLNIGTIAIISLVLLAISPRLFLISSIIIPVYTIVIVVFMPLFNKWNTTRMEANAEVSSQIIEDLHGIETIKALSVEDKIFNKFSKSFNKFLKANYMYNVMNSIQDSLKDIIELLSNLLILYFGSFMAIKGAITAGQLVTFTALMSYFLEPIQSLINLQNELQTASVANKRINQVMEAVPERLGEISESILLNGTDNVINLEGVSFEYKYGQEVLHNINLHIRRHRSLAIVGLSGSGKSTLAKILVNFYTPKTGNVEIDGHDIRDIDNRSLRSYICYLPQTPHVFSGTVMENILLGNDSATEADVFKVAKVAEIHNEILDLPLGYQTQLSDDSGLSGGQLQRISIARTLLSPAKIIILDESTSNLDIETEKKILENIHRLHMTVIFIAHRLQVAKQADDIVVMRNGKIIEHGAQSKLLEQKGKYYELVK